MFLLWILLTVGVAVGMAQSTACPELVTQALQAVSLACENLERNTVCYGNNRLEATFDADAQVTFNQPADRAPVEDLQKLQTFPMDVTQGFWGVALMNIQANLPDTLPGQSVKFILYGDVTLQNAATAEGEFAPMQAFYFTSNSLRPSCGEVPPDALIIQSPEGQQVNLNVNGLGMTIGSTVALRAQANQHMSITTLEGEAITRYEDEVRYIPQGFAAAVPLGGEDGLTVEDGPEDLHLIDDEEWETIAESSEEIWDEEVEVVDTDEWDSLDDYCADPANADICDDPAFSESFADCDETGCFEEAEMEFEDCVEGEACDAFIDDDTGDDIDADDGEATFDEADEDDFEDDDGGETSGGEEPADDGEETSEDGEPADDAGGEEADE